jgi:hypothetical protein
VTISSEFNKLIPRNALSAAFDKLRLTLHKTELSRSDLPDQLRCRLSLRRSFLLRHLCGMLLKRTSGKPARGEREAGEHSPHDGFGMNLSLRRPPKPVADRFLLSAFANSILCLCLSNNVLRERYSCSL